MTGDREQVTGYRLRRERERFWATLFFVIYVIMSVFFHSPTYMFLDYLWYIYNVFSGVIGQ